MESIVFQADSPIVNELYEKGDNYIIDYNKAAPENYCILYFSSNDLYFPNTDIAFKEQLVQKNRFEWFKNRIGFGKKHIFIRDIKKQWYLTGINARLDSPWTLSDFLREETDGYKVITVGASAGGFAAILHGQLLNAERIYSFNGQFEINSLLHKSSADKDPVIFRNQDNKTLRPYYDTLPFIKTPQTIFYFRSTAFQWDIEQNIHAGNLAINRISFKTNNHGIPFLRSNIPAVLNLPLPALTRYCDKTMHPLSFSLRLVGPIQTIKGLNSILRFALNKLYINTFLKWKTALSRNGNTQIHN